MKLGSHSVAECEGSFTAGAAAAPGGYHRLRPCAVSLSSVRSTEWAVCVYCASGPTDPALLALAAQVGAAIAERGWTLVWGGGNVSAMGALAAAARARGGKTVGVIPKALLNRELTDADVDADELIVTDTMRQRKQLMDENADAFLTLPGGLGTLEELFETWTGAYLGMHHKPVVLLDPDGHYAGLWDWLAGLVAAGYVTRQAMQQLLIVDDVTAALDACAPDSPGSE